jgi:hypothetical protein
LIVARTRFRPPVADDQEMAMMKLKMVMSEDDHDAASLRDC